VLAQPVPACLAALALLNIKPVQNSVAVEYINSRPPSKRLAMVNWAGNDIQRKQAATELYVHRLPRHQDLTFEQYFSAYIVDTNPARALVRDQRSSQELLTEEDKNRGEAPLQPLRRHKATAPPHTQGSRTTCATRQGTS
jgi:hypothetical protein